MGYRKMKIKKKILCIIPARGGSKGLKGKNVQKVNGRPLIFYPIASAIKSRVCDDIFVSTDDKKIAKEAIKYGADVPFLRKKKFAGDLVSTEETLKNALDEYEMYKGIKYDICVFLTCTNIFRKYSFITKAVQNLKGSNFLESSFVVKKIYKHFWHEDKKKLKKVLPWMKEYTSRQIAPNLYLEQTSLACATRSKFWRKGKRIGEKVKLIINEDSFSTIDIHSEEDLYMARMAMNYKKKNNV